MLGEPGSLVAEPQPGELARLERVPESVVDGKTFEEWREEAEKTNPDLLVLSLDDVLRSQPDLDPKEVQVQLYAGQINASGQIESPQARPMKYVKQLGPGLQRVGIDPTYPPFDMVANGQVSGYDAELARGIGADLGVHVEFMTLALDTVYDALAAGKVPYARREAEVVLEMHLEVLENLRLDEESDRRVRHELQLLKHDLLHEVAGWRQSTSGAEFSDRLASFGERFSARLFAAALEKLEVASVPVTSSEFVLTCDTFRDAQPHLEQSKLRGRKILLPLLKEGTVPVVTGFIGATPDGRITTLGRNSSDFSGAIVAQVVDADELVIWTDVDGIYTANPQESAEARLLHELSYDEAHALAASGAKVLHPKVLPLAAESEMVVWVRNTFNPQARGTRIGPASECSSALPSGGAV